MDEIFHNKLDRDFYLSNDKKIPAGTKIIRAFKYFESNEQILRELQDKLSMIHAGVCLSTLQISIEKIDNDGLTGLFSW